jgi:aminomethyltransferase
MGVKEGQRRIVGPRRGEKIQREPLARKLVGFEVTGRGVARHGYPLLDAGGRVIGMCTSGSPAPTVGKNIGLGYLPSAMAEVGANFLVECRGKNVEATVVKTPFYKRGDTRVSSGANR